ncbi:MAG: mechanosensitive ion channel domain-containing protein [Pseudomonadota bacterium]
MDQLRDQVALFEDLGPDDNPALFDQLIDIRARYNDAQQRQVACRQIVNDAGDLLQSVNERISELAARYLWSRTASIIGLAATAPDRVRSWPDRIRTGMSPQVSGSMDMLRLLWLLVAAGAIAIGAGVFARYRFARWYEQAGYPARGPQLRALLPKPLAVHAPLLLLGVTLMLTLMFATDNATLDLAAMRVAYGITLFGLGCVVIDWSTGALSPAAQVTGFYPEHVVPTRRRLRALMLVIVVSYVVLGRSWLSISQRTEYDPLSRMLMIVALCLALWSVFSYFGRVNGLRRFRVPRLMGFVALAVALGAALLGYLNFASYMTHGVVRTFAAIIVVWILLWLVFSLFESIIDGSTAVARRFRDFASTSESDSRTGFGIMQLTADIIIWFGFAVYLVYVWDSSGVTLDQITKLIMEGDTIGGIELQPLRIAIGLLTFAVLIALTGWIKRLIDKRWLRHMNMDRGARDAIVTLSGYIGFVVAVLIALNAAEINLAGLAIVGGALALGIGFGLQAIASNFVSGLILLFERPIKAGDFVTVGGVEGFVRRIRIRATDIETLDNQNVLVPNSELVSGHVTNWVLRNPQGRLRIRVGVAYGSDVDLVRALMEEIGRGHEDVITDGQAPAPRALFMGFGDSSLDFELRVRIRRIEKRFTVISDINFAIDKAFREHNITIPFPQRDLHLISLPENQQSTAVEAPPAEEEKPPRPRRPEPAADEITRRIRQQLRLNASVERIWTALTDADELQRWYGREVEIAARIGGNLRATLHDDSEVDAVIDIFMPPRRLRFAQRTPDGEGPLPTGPVSEEITLLQDSDSVLMTVNVTGIPADEDWEGFYRRTEQHWETSLKELRKLLRVSAKGS